MGLTSDQRNLIEKFGVFQERAGMPPTEARILALLLIADKTEFTFDEIREILQISKSATSNALNILLKFGKVDYITKPGDRRRYFGVKLKNWEDEVEAKLQTMLSINDLLKDVLKQRTPKSVSFNKDLKHMTEFNDFLQNELGIVLKKWKAR